MTRPIGEAKWIVQNDMKASVGSSSGIAAANPRLNKGQHAPVDGLRTPEGEPIPPNGG